MGSVNDIQNERDTDPDTDETNSLVSSLLKPIYEILYKVKPKNIVINRYMWFILTIIVLLIGVYYKWVNLSITIWLFILVLVLEFASANFEVIKNMFRYHNRNKIDKFIEELGSYDLTYILDFLDNNQMDTKDLIKVLETRYKTNSDLHKRIIIAQDISCDLIDYIVNSNIIRKLPENIISRYVFYCNTKLNEQSLNILDLKRSKLVKGALVATHPEFYRADTLTKILLLPLFHLNAWVTNLFKNRNLKVLVLIILTIIFMFVTESLLTGDSNVYGTSNFVGRLVGHFIVNMIIAGFVIYLLNKIYFKISLPIWGFIYRNNRIKHVS